MQSIGDKIKTRRKLLGLSQQNLAEGICEQSLISKIERNNYIPHADVLYKIAKTSSRYKFIFQWLFETINDLQSFVTMSSKLLEHRNYTDLEYIYNLEKIRKNI